MGSSIETGVDKLVKIVEQEGRISLKKASKELGVSEIVVEEWADFLEEEGIISLEYKLAQLYLVRRKMTQKELDQKHKEFSGKKEGFVRRAEVMMVDLDKDNAQFKRIKEEFDDLKKELSKDLSGMKLKLGELEKFERVKEGLDKEIEAHQKDIVRKMGELTKQIEKEKVKYHDILLEMRDEEKLLAKRTEEALSLREQYDIIKTHIKEFQKAVKDIEGALRKEESGISDVDSHIDKLKKKAESIQSNLLHKMSSLDELIKEKRAKEQQILNKENEILVKAKEKGEQLKGEGRSGRKTLDTFKRFFSEKKKVESLINEINRDRDDLERELKELVRKAHAVSAAKKSHDFGKHADDIQKKFKDVVKKKEKHESAIRKLTSLLGMKR